MHYGFHDFILPMKEKTENASKGNYYELHQILKQRYVILKLGPWFLWTFLNIIKNITTEKGT